MKARSKKKRVEKLGKYAVWLGKVHVDEECS